MPGYGSFQGTEVNKNRKDIIFFEPTVVSMHGSGGKAQMVSGWPFQEQPGITSSPSILILHSMGPVMLLASSSFCSNGGSARPNISLMHMARGSQWSGGGTAESKYI
jgi:hypothetical protein